MTNIPFYQVDAFTNQALKGNPAAIMLLNEFLPDDILHKIAIENNLSETAFLVKNGKGYDLRWFTPAYEVNLCGHATLASAHIIFTELYPSQDLLQFFTRSGTLTVKRIDEGKYEMNFPADHAEIIETPEEIKALFDTEIKACLRGKDDYMVVLSSQEEIEQLQPNIAAIKMLKSRGILVTAAGSEVDFVSRCFFPQAGVDEDPVTGSAHTLMAPYWSKVFDKKELVARQLSPRCGEVHCTLAGERIYLTGDATTIIKGAFTI